MYIVFISSVHVGVPQNYHIIEKRCIGQASNPATRVAGEHSTTEPPMQMYLIVHTKLRAYLKLKNIDITTIFILFTEHAPISAHQLNFQKKYAQAYTVYLNVIHVLYHLIVLVVITFTST